MRLSQLNKYIAEFDTTSSQLISRYESGNTFIINIQKFKLFLEYIEILDFYKNEVLALYSSSLYKTTNDELSLPRENGEKIIKLANYLFNSFNALSITLPNLIPASNEHSIDIKLPIPSNLNSLNKTLAMLEKSISQVVTNKTIKGIVNVNHWEYGSYWIEIILGT